jgi:hypothetical protein
MHVGTVRRVLDPKSATVAIDGSGEVVVALNRDAILQHSCGSRPSDLSSFVPGEPVVIVGRLEESRLQSQLGPSSRYWHTLA